jgi:hypothetical protein
VSDEVNWQPISMAPKDGIYILLRFETSIADKEWPQVAVGKAIDRDGGWWLTSGWAGTTAHAQPTHWMPIPRGPQPDSDGGGV